MPLAASARSGCGARSRPEFVHLLETSPTASSRPPQRTTSPGIAWPSSPTRLVLASRARRTSRRRCAGLRTRCGGTASQNVHLEKVMVPRWVRGEERASLVEPFPSPLVMAGLGMSVGTPPGGITAEVLVVASFEELEARKAEAGVVSSSSTSPTSRTARTSSSAWRRRPSPRATAPRRCSSVRWALPAFARPTPGRCPTRPTPQDPCGGPRPRGCQPIAAHQRSRPADRRSPGDAGSQRARRPVGQSRRRDSGIGAARRRSCFSGVTPTPGTSEPGPWTMAPAASSFGRL